MSIRAIAAVLDLAPAAVTPPERLVLVALAWHADEHGRNAWPAVSTICRKTSLARRTVQRVLPRLKQKGLVYIQSVAARGSVRYGVDLKALDCARVTQSAARDCAPETQSAAATGADGLRPSDAGGRHSDTPTASPWHGGGVTVTPDPSLKEKTVLEEEPGDHAERSSKREEPGGRVHERASREAREILSEDLKEGGRTYVVPPAPDTGPGAADGLGLRPAASAPPAAPDPTEAENDDDDDAVLSVAELQAIADRLFDELGDDVSMSELEPAFIQAAHIRPSDPFNDVLGGFLFNVRKIRRRPRLILHTADRAYGVR